VTALIATLAWDATTLFAIDRGQPERVVLSLVGSNFVFLVSYVLGQTYLDAILKTAVQVIHGPTEDSPKPSEPAAPAASDSTA
jgi:hypothetical protein